jgi:DnaJ-class molecular chaperone
MNLTKYVNKKTEQEEIIVCPYCKGTGEDIEENRVSWDETEYIHKECYLCKGKRVVKRKITTEYLEIK